MDFLQKYAKEIVSLFIPLLTWLLNTFFHAKALLELSSPHTFTYLVQQPLVDSSGKQLSPTQIMHTRSTVIRNTGRATATRVEMVFNWKPLCINIWPPRHFQEYVETDKRYVLIFDSLAPNEYIGCESFSLNADLPDLILVRSDQCVAKTIDMCPQPVLPSWQIRIAQVFLFAGMGLVVYLAILFIQFLVLKTPFRY